MSNNSSSPALTDHLLAIENSVAEIRAYSSAPQQPVEAIIWEVAFNEAKDKADTYRIRFARYYPTIISIVMAGSYTFVPNCLPQLPLPPLIGIVFTVATGLLDVYTNNKLSGLQILFFILSLVFTFGIILDQIKKFSSSCAFFISFVYTMQFMISFIISIPMSHSLSRWPRIPEQPDPHIQLSLSGSGVEPSSPSHSDNRRANLLKIYSQLYWPTNYTYTIPLTIIEFCILVVTFVAYIVVWVQCDRNCDAPNLNINSQGKHQTTELMYWATATNCSVQCEWNILIILCFYSFAIVGWLIGRHKACGLKKDLHRH